MSDTDLKCEVLKNDLSEYDLSFKLIIVGDSGVGKSCLSIKATKNYFEDQYAPTVGFEFLSFNLKINNNFIRLQIWDTCGQEAYRSLINSFYRNSSLAILIYSIESKNSFENLETWLNDIKTHSNPDIKIILIGNKIDLEDKREVPKESGEKFCNSNKLCFFMETSAKTGFNAQNLFIEAGKILYNEYLRVKDNISRPGSIATVPYIPDIADSETEEDKIIILNYNIETANSIKDEIKFNYIAIMPPCEKELRNRLIKRGTKPEEITNRMNNSLREMQLINEANYIDFRVVNDKEDTCLRKIEEHIKELYPQFF